MAKKRFMISMDEALLQKMEKACESQGVSKSAYISMVVAKDIGDTEKLMFEFRKVLGQMVEDSGLELTE